MKKRKEIEKLIDIGLEYRRKYQKCNKMFATFIYFTLCIFVIVLFLFIINLPSEPEFKITKEECKNPNYEIQVYSCEVGCMQGKNATIDCFNLCKEYFADEYFQICEIKEVEGILYNFDFFSMATTKELWEYRYYCEEIYYFPENFVEPTIACYKNKKLKEDLTIEWLEENCEMEWKEGDVKCYKNTIGAVPCGRNPSYICGEYFVEVIK